MGLEDYGEVVDGVNYLTVEDLKFINYFVIQKYTPEEPYSILKPNELESLQAKPAMYRYYNQTDDMFKLASVLIVGIVLNHCFANGNKRTAFIAGYIFLLLNGYELTAPSEEVIEVMVGVAEKTVDASDVERWLAYWSRDFDARILCAPLEEFPVDFLRDLNTNRS
ncbi:type II toxin-antitoxin system death-on-curing family toxin [Gilliamella sp. B14384H2]|uniref:type II toxin-antitoxin system death-on-curing family toxin n=1 Tax=unclassified Gilliamella TaxID=2685620 RepID=UPI0018DE29E4|nr:MULTISPECIES: type II toxin-antitoxin system death-on-curing family toxin [unclassified Gilliamella]MBI0037759.1 type II toxin-antitoxin system death-on-curing family toxin [Gilliamella sp. B14384G10]MBI0039754.1 type II toxin-antitoxin system death-on-curing family toxin [Gilliamella sp. B14384G7]MBI0051594.1 type II toxin-antitoxin system death-on-curing family toxin [Gilliamella sp. B14384G13]MBI0054046.1 type II toxin-antitoxin system death-on-curing family toxin [Gilliamella sp. B14384H